MSLSCRRCHRSVVRMRYCGPIEEHQDENPLSLDLGKGDSLKVPPCVRIAGVCKVAATKKRRGALLEKVIPKWKYDIPLSLILEEGKIELLAHSRFMYTERGILERKDNVVCDNGGRPRRHGLRHWHYKSTPPYRSRIFF